MNEKFPNMFHENLAIRLRNLKIVFKFGLEAVDVNVKGLQLLR